MLWFGKRISLDYFDILLASAASDDIPSAWWKRSEDEDDDRGEAPIMRFGKRALLNRALFLPDPVSSIDDNGGYSPQWGPWTDRGDARRCLIVEWVVRAGNSILGKGLDMAVMRIKYSEYKEKGELGCTHFLS